MAKIGEARGRFRFRQLRKICSMISTGRASSMERVRRDGVGLGIGATLGEADGRSERPDRDCEELLRLGILKGRPGGRLGLGLDPGRGDLEIFASRLACGGRLAGRRLAAGSSPFRGAMIISTTARSHQRAPPQCLWQGLHGVLDVS